MDKAETAKVLTVIKVSFPAFYKGITKADAEATVEIWAREFADDGLETVMAAVQMHVANSKYPPTIAEIKDHIPRVTQQEGMSVQEAWALASKAAAGNLAWKKLPPLVQKAIGSENVLRDWGRVPIETFNTVIYSQFIKAYGIWKKREDEWQRLPSAVKELIGQISNTMALGDGGGRNELPEGN